MTSSSQFRKKLLLTGIVAFAAGFTPAGYAQDDGALEEVIVRGIRSSLERSIDIKRDSNQMVEAITADDIGKMPDQNIAESLQRLPGVQIDRRDGVGTQVRIRGLNQNITLLNGESFFSGMENFQMGESQVQLNNSLEGVPSELLGGVEVYKTPTASMVEGAMGGIVNLKTRSSLDLKELLFAANIKMDEGAHSKEAETSGFVVLGNNWGDTFGAILSLTMDNRVVHNDMVQNFSRENTGVLCTESGQWGGYDRGCISELGDFDSDGTDNPGVDDDGDGAVDELRNLAPMGQSYLAPGYFYVTDSEQTRERTGAAVNLQWRPTDSLEFAMDWFHSELDIEMRQYSIKHPVAADGATGVNENAPYEVLGGVGPRTVGVLQSGTFILTGGETGGNPGLEINSGGDNTNVVSDNYAFSGAFDNGGKLRLSFNLAGAATELEQRSGWGDQRLTPYGFNGWNGDTTGGNNGYTRVTPNQVPGDPGTRYYSFVNGPLPAFHWQQDEILTNPNYATYKSHWALGSNFENEFFAGRVDAVWDINAGDFKNLKFGFRAAEEEADFDQLRWLNGFHQTVGAQSPTIFNADGVATSISNFDGSVAPAANMMNVGVQEALYYDLCGNGGFPSGDFTGNANPGSTGFCDIDGDGVTDNAGVGPYGYFVDAAIGLKAFDLSSSSGVPMIEVLYNPDAIDPVTNLLKAYDPDPDGDPDTDDGAFLDGTPRIHQSSSRFAGGSPNSVPWQTFNDNPSRYITLTNFFPSGGYNSSIIFEDADKIAADPESWIDNVVTPNVPGEWFVVPVNTWTVKESTTAFYGESDLEGELGSTPYSLNIGIRVVKTEVDVTHAVVDDPQALAEQWSQSTDIWNSQGALLSGTYDFVTETQDYTDTLPSINFVLNTSDSTKFRASAASVIARPDLRNLGQGLLLNYTRITDSQGDYFQYTGGNGGNAQLDPFRADQFDVAYEWYFGDLGLLAAGIFYKDVESFIQNAVVPEFHEDVRGGRIAGVTRPLNGLGGSVKGLELAFQNSWENGLGFALNYTYSDSETDTTTTINENVGLPGVSKHAYNATGFFDNGTVSARLAYTWRDVYLSPFRSSFNVIGLDNGASEYFDDYGQWDANVTWNVTDQFSLTLEAINITDEYQSSYLGYENRPMTYTTVEPRVVVGASFRL
jgi:outer membrane receptor for ferrienterochelin and colicin